MKEHVGGAAPRVDHVRPQTCSTQGLLHQLSGLCRLSIDSITNAKRIRLPIMSPNHQDQDQAVQPYYLYYPACYITLQKTTGYYSGFI